MKKLCFLPVLLFATIAWAQKKTVNVQLINPSSVAAPRGYSHAAVIDLGTARMIILSGQVALDKQGNLVGKDDMEKQTEQVFANIKSIVEEAGGTMGNIVKLGYYLTDVKQIQAVRKVRDKFINTQQPPASTLVEVSRLFREDVLIEIEATAVIPKK
ncbi:MAG TPA: RidA family protein [Chitinophaga sp.]|uniref:RidA family protein n=1 Tax=Chitinophaga sp. TaxID=1869181 RepID=UPI002C05A82A|nr:RidA family protein [Chitinophaga sp.]HVI43603.1 RidA family protein [Chitinophaga sp.]